MKSLIAAALFLFALAASPRAFAASYEVQVRQLSPEGESKTADCSSSRECTVPMILKGQIRTEPVIVHIDFSDGVVSFKFQNFRGYLYAGARGGAKSTELNGSLDENGYMKTNVTVYLLAAPVRYKSYQMPVVHGEYAAIADLEITISPSQ